MSDHTDFVTVAKNGGEIVISVSDKEVFEEAKMKAALMGDVSDEKLVAVATEIAEKAIMDELKKTNAFDPSVESTVIVDTKLPIEVL